MRGVLYGVGVGPGDPELLTLKAINILEKVNVIVVPDTKGINYALETVSKYVQGKECILCAMPMTKDTEILRTAHDDAANIIMEHLSNNTDVAFITIGDPTVYSTYMYVHEIVSANAFETKIISGVTSFCASAAALEMSLCLGNDPLHLIPALAENFEELLTLPGTKVIMKSGSQLERVKESLKKHNLFSQAFAVERCGTVNEKVYRSLDEMPNDAAYFSTIIVKEECS